MINRRGKPAVGQDQDPDAKKLSKKSLKKLLGIFKYTLPYRTNFILGMIALLFSSSTLLAFPYFAGKLLDAAQGKTDWILKGINQITIGLILILLVQSIFSFLRIYLFARVSEKAIADVRYDLYKKLMLLPISFYDNNRVGELISRITSDVSMLKSAFTTTLAEFIRQILTLLIGTIAIIFITPKLSGFMFATFPFIVITAIIFGRFIRRLSKQTQDELATTNIIVEETLQAVRVVKAFTNEVFERNRYRKSLSSVISVALKAATYRGMFASFIIFGLFGGIVMVMWYGATLVQNGDISVGDLLSFVLYTTFIGGSIGGLSSIYGEIQAVVGATERVLEINNETVESGTEGKGNTPDFTQPLSFENVSFQYPSRKELAVLQDLSFSINPGEKVALIGQSGSGKSTITQLILRFYESTSGNILLGSENILGLDLYSYREEIGIVPQEVILFGGSIRENIAYGNTEASEEEINQAASKANALEFIETFPEGLNTIVGERGIKLSGGQKQRIAIARAILKDPKVLILDEATSSLDTESEILVQGALDKLMEGRTSLIIAHRLSTIRNADRIMVIEQGGLKESGTHQELMAKDDGQYSHLLKLQFEE